MADQTKIDKLTFEELMVSTLAMADATVKLLIAEGAFTDDEVKHSQGTNGRITWRV